MKKRNLVLSVMATCLVSCFLFLRDKEDTGMSSQKKSSRLEGKDLITIGIYTVIYVVIVMLVAMLGFIPVFIPLMAVLCPLIGGILADCV